MLSWILKLDQPWSGGVKIKDGLSFVEDGVQGCRTLEGTERGNASTPG